MTTIQMLHCIGCDNAVAQYRPDQTLAISCRCGAAAPILSLGPDTAKVPGLPASLLLNAKPVGHWEYYLGYSDHESDVKKILIVLLEARGISSQADCEEEEGCR